MNVAGVMLLRFIGGLEHSAAAQAAYTIGYTELFSMITWTSVGLMGAAATIAGQNLGAGQPDRALHGVYAAAKIGLKVAAVVGAMFLLIPIPLLGIFGATEGTVADIGASCCATWPSPASSSAPRSPSPVVSRARATRRVRSSSRWSRRWRFPSGSARCSSRSGSYSPRISGSPYCSGTSRAARCRSCASARGSGGRSRSTSSPPQRRSACPRFI